MVTAEARRACLAAARALTASYAQTAWNYAGVTIRGIQELVNVSDPAWPAISELVGQSASAQVVEGDPAKGQAVLWRLQMTVRSYLRALALHTGGVLADHGWFRLLGGGGLHLTDLATANDLAEPQEGTPPPPLLIVGYDVLGGRFAIDGGGLGVGAGGCATSVPTP